MTPLLLADLVDELKQVQRHLREHRFAALSGVSTVSVSYRRIVYEDYLQAERNVTEALLLLGHTPPHHDYEGPL